MNAAQKWIIIGFGLLLLLVVLFPPWQQTYRGEPLAYRGELGHHFLWPRPQATGEKSWVVNAPAADCEVVVKLAVIFRECGVVIVMAAILIFTFRNWPADPITTKKLLITSLLLALCLPLPPPDGLPLAIYVGLAPIAPFGDNGHLGPWFVPLLAAGGLAVYFPGVSLLLSGVIFLSRRRDRMSRP